MVEEDTKIKSLGTQVEALDCSSMKDSALEKFIIHEGKVSRLPRTGSASITVFSHNPFCGIHHKNFRCYS